jgi:hypothetical protein
MDLIQPRMEAPQQTDEGVSQRCELQPPACAWLRSWRPGTVSQRRPSVIRVVVLAPIILPTAGLIHVAKLLAVELDLIGKPE